MATLLTSSSVSSVCCTNSNSNLTSMMPKRISTSSVPPTLLVRDSTTSTLHDLRLLLALDKYQRGEENRDISRLLFHFKALKASSRDLFISRDRSDLLHESFKRETDPPAFYSLYKQYFQDLQTKLIDSHFNDQALQTCLFQHLTSRNGSLITQFIYFLRTNPEVVGTILGSYHSEELYELIRPNTFAPKSNSIPDIFLHVLYDSPHFPAELLLRQNAWKSVLITLIAEKKGDNFMMEVLDRYVRLHQWSPQGALEVTLMKLLRQGEDSLKILADEDSSRTKPGILRSRSQSYASNFLQIHPPAGIGSSPYHTASAAEVDKFLDNACLELLSLLHHYVPPALISLTHAILAELPPRLHHYATIQVMVKFFFYRFLGKVLCYPEFFGICEDIYISEKRRQKILFTIHQRLYRYVTAVTSSVPGWSRRSLNIDPRIRTQVEKLVSLFSLPNSSDQAFTEGQEPSCPLLVPIQLSQVPSPKAYPSVLPTLLISSEDIIDLHLFFSTYTQTLDIESLPSTAPKQAFYQLVEMVTRLQKTVSDLKLLDSNYSTLLHVESRSERRSGNVAFAEDMTPPFTSLNFMNPITTLEDEGPMLPTAQTIGDSLFKALDHYGDSCSHFVLGQSLSSHPYEIESVPGVIKLAAVAARFYNHLGDAVTFSHSLDLLAGLPEDLTKDSYAGLIRDLSRGIERAKAVRDLHFRERQAWQAYGQEFETQLRRTASRLEARCSTLRLHVFYSHFRASRTFEKHRTTIIDLANRTKLDETESTQVENYLQSNKITDFVPGDDRFHLFCLRIQALCSTAMTNLWACEGYSYEASLFREASRSRSSTFSQSNSSFSVSSPVSSSASSLRSGHVPSHSATLFFDDNDKTTVRGLAFATYADPDFPSGIQLRITALLLSEFFSAFRSTDVDSWFGEFVSDYEPPESDIESKSYNTSYSNHHGITLVEPMDKLKVYESPPPLSSCSLSPMSDSSTSASSVTISQPLGGLKGHKLELRSYDNYQTLCNQVTLHHSPLQKLRVFFALELQIVANLSTSDNPGTDSIINEMERIFRRTRPRHLFRDLQLVAAFVPSSTLDLTDEGKAFWDISLAALSLKREAVDRAVSRGMSLLESMARRPVSSDAPIPADQLDILEQRQQTEALRLFTLAAKEGHVAAQRELGILYLSLPSSLDGQPPVPSPSASSFLGVIYGNSSPSHSPTRTPRGQGGDKYDPANVASALHWFGRAATQGDGFSLQYLTHRGGASSLPPAPRLSTHTHPHHRRSSSRPQSTALGLRRSSSSPSSPEISNSSPSSVPSKLSHRIDTSQKFSA